MGVCYKLILEDECDWGYSETSKEEQLKKFAEAYGGYCEYVTGWDHYAVFDIDKCFPYSDEDKKTIREYCDRAYTIDDGQIGQGIKQLDLSKFYNKPSEQAKIDWMNSRRTEEEKKASEDIVRKKLERMK